MIIRLATLIVVLCVCAGCRKSATFDPEQYKREVEDWRKQRLVQLTSDDGWLTLVGLFWLKEGENTELFAVAAPICWAGMELSIITIGGGGGKTIIMIGRSSSVY